MSVSDELHVSHITKQDSLSLYWQLNWT